MPTEKSVYDYITHKTECTFTFFLAFMFSKSYHFAWLSTVIVKKVAACRGRRSEVGG